MSSVTFSPTVGGDGSTVTDDTNPTTGLDGGGHRTRFVPALAQTVAVAAHTVGQAELATTKAGEAVTAKDDAVTARNEAVAARDTAVTTTIPALVAQVDTDRVNAQAAITADVTAVDNARNTAVNTTIPGHVTAVETRRDTAIDTEIPGFVTAVDASRVTAQSAMTADVNEVEASKQLGLISINQAIGSSQAQANASTTAATNLAGITSTYLTHALATAGLGGIAANAFVGVLQDETRQGQGSVYQKVSSALVYVQYLSYPRKNQTDAWGIRSYPRNSVITHIGDSRVDQALVWGGIFTASLQGKNGPFEGWTSYNMGANGTSLSGWAASISSGDQSAPPINSASANLWRTVNANPQAIYFSLLTNDFRTGAGPAQIEAKITTARANLQRVLDFLLQRTSATIILGMPPPIAFANPDPGGYTDCVNADDAAARSAAMRMLYLEWLNVSDRVLVIDTHRHIFGYRLDTVAAAVDAETGAALMTDTLHPTSLGARRIAQTIERVINPAAPYTSSGISLGDLTSETAIFAQAHWIKTVHVVGAGTNYIDVRRNPLLKQYTEINGPLVNLPIVQSAAFYAQNSDVKEFSRIGAFYIYFHSTGNTFGPLTASSATDEPASSRVRLLVTGAFGGNTGPATIYVTDQQSMPYAPSKGIDHAVIAINGPQPLTVDAMGATSLNLLQGSKILGVPTATRQNSSGAATIGIYMGNVVTGDITVGGVFHPYPGIELGVLTLANSARSTGFTTGNFAVNMTNYPSGVITLTASRSVVLSAKVLTGSLGLYGQVTIPFTRP